MHGAGEERLHEYVQRYFFTVQRFLTCMIFSYKKKNITRMDFLVTQSKLQYKRLRGKRKRKIKKRQKFKT
jgi:hypothetical protein